MNLNIFKRRAEFPYSLKGYYYALWVGEGYYKSELMIYGGIKQKEHFNYYKSPEHWMPFKTKQSLIKSIKQNRPKDKDYEIIKSDRILIYHNFTKLSE